MSEIMKLIRSSIFVQLILSYVFIVSGLFINAIQCLTLLIWPFNKSLFKKLNCYLHYCMLSFLTGLTQWWNEEDIEIYCAGNDFEYLGKENTICIPNHRHDIDWLIGYIIWQNCNMLVGGKALLKDSIKYVPIVGWSLAFSENLFLKRNWKEDRESMIKTLKSVNDYPKDLQYNGVFCEGTRFNEEKHKASLAYAKLKGLPELQHHLLPRTKGFITLLQTISNKFDAVYDWTFAIEKNKNGKLPTMNGILKGDTVKVKAFFRRIQISAVPKNDEDKCQEFLIKLYQEKDKIYDVYAKTGDFSQIGKKVKIEKNKNDLWITIIAISIVIPISFYYLLIELLYGSIYFKIVFMVIIFIVNQITIRMTTTSHQSSEYGLKKTD